MVKGHLTGLHGHSIVSFPFDWSVQIFNQTFFSLLFEVHVLVISLRLVLF